LNGFARVVSASGFLKLNCGRRFFARNQKARKRREQFAYGMGAGLDASVEKGRPAINSRGFDPFSLRLGTYRDTTRGREPGGGISFASARACLIQGSTDIPTLYDILPGYLPMPKSGLDSPILAGNNTFLRHINTRSPRPRLVGNLTIRYNQSVCLKPIITARGGRKKRKKQIGASNYGSRV